MPLRSLASVKTPSLLRPILSGAVAWGFALLLLGVESTAARAQGPTRNTAPEVPGAAAKQSSVTKPLWRDLSARQQRALEPLAPHWDSLAEPHKRKWLALSRNYAKLPPADREILHSRMIEWAALSNQQRTQARFNFAEVKQVPVDERKAKWEAYQALSEEEKRRLAERATPRPGAAAAIRPVPSQKLAPLPAVAADGQHTPRIQLAPPAPLPLRPQVVAPAPALAPSPTPAPAFPPVAAEAQVPPPSSTLPAEAAFSASQPTVRVNEQPASAP